MLATRLPRAGLSGAAAPAAWHVNFGILDSRYAPVRVSSVDSIPVLHCAIYIAVRPLVGLKDVAHNRTSPCVIADVSLTSIH